MQVTPDAEYGRKNGCRLVLPIDEVERERLDAEVTAWLAGHRRAGRL